MKLRKRVICALTGLACVALLTSCTPHSDGTHPVTITDAGNTSDLASPPIQNATGWEVTFPETATTARALCARTSGAATYFKTQISRPDTSSAAPAPGNTLVSLNPQDGSARWARQIAPKMYTLLL